MSKQTIHFALTIFLSAFLLFQVQPLIGKYILPWFGGSPAVWTTCLLFFQTALLAGYAYAHWVVRWRRQNYQCLVHLSFLIGTVLLLPIVPNDGWKPLGSESPTWLILGLLTLTIGAPYFFLSTTGPLLQAWYSKAFPDRSPYRLYALSNAGSVLGLLTYPFLVEPLVTRQNQALAWSVTYIAFVLGLSWCALHMVRRASRSGISADVSGNLSGTRSLLPDDKELLDSRLGDDLVHQAMLLPHPPLTNVLYWLILAACGSTLLLATTNQLCQDVAVVPFLWVLPLSLYLLTFIIAFEGRRWYRRSWCIPLLVAASFLAIWVIHQERDVSIIQKIVIYSLVLFAGCMICHGELAQNKPGVKYLTLFYLSIAVGGALGGIFVALAAPFLFTGYWEFHLALSGAVAVAFGVLFFEARSPLRQGKPLWAWILAVMLYAVLIVALLSAVLEGIYDSLAASRSFFGVLSIKEYKDDNKGIYRKLLHGGVAHGIQYIKAPWRNRPTTYYGKGTGAWLALQHHPRRGARRPMRLGVIGLGTGTIAALGNKEDTIRFYEIDPEVIRFSKQWFWYQKDTPASVKIVLGDARIQLERELAQGQNQQFDVLLVDAFNGGAIPLHLLTHECVQIYRRHLKDDGILAMHVSNKHLDLIPVTLGLAQALGWEAVLIDAGEDLQGARWASTWVLITNNLSFLKSKAVQKSKTPWPQDSARLLLWSDDYASLLHVLK
jgi:hypothetical protein